MLEINDLSVKYDSLEIYSHCSLTLKRNRIYGLVGRNGEGKTTLFNSICGLKSPSSGTITWNGSKMFQEEIAYLPAEVFFYPKITGSEYLEIFAFNNANVQIAKLNEYFTLPLEAYIENYSTGMKKQLALLGLIAMNRSIWLLDEPFNSLDYESVHVLSSILKYASKKNKLIIVSSHLIDILRNICDEILLINDKMVYEKSANSELTYQDIYRNVDSIDSINSLVI